MKKFLALALFAAATPAHTKIRVGEYGGCSISGSTVTCTGGRVFTGCFVPSHGDGFMCDGIFVHRNGRIEKVPMPAPREAPRSQP